MSLGNRIRALRKSMGLSQPALAKKAGLGQSTISELENDKKGTSAENLQAIAKALGTTQEYLLTGCMTPTRFSNIPIVGGALVGGSGMAGTATSNRLFSIFQKSDDSDDAEIRYFDDISVSCGSGSFGEILEKDAKILKIKKQPLQERNISKNNCVAFPASGDSMLPTIKDKDTVYVDLGRNQIKDGKIFAICHGGLFKFKRLYNLPLGGIRIVSDNAAEFPEERLTAQEIIDQQFEIIGWAWSWQSMENW